MEPLYSPSPLVLSSPPPSPAQSGGQGVPSLAPVLLMPVNLALLVLLLIWTHKGAGKVGLEDWVAAYLGASLATAAQVCLLTWWRGAKGER